MEAGQSTLFLRILLVEIAIPFLVMEKWYGPFSDLALILVVWLLLLSSPPFYLPLSPIVLLASTVAVVWWKDSGVKLLLCPFWVFFQASVALWAAWSACNSPPLHCHYGFKSLFCLMCTSPYVTFDPRRNNSIWIRSRVHYCLFAVQQRRRPPSAAREGIAWRWCNHGVIHMYMCNCCLFFNTFAAVSRRGRSS